MYEYFLPPQTTFVKLCFKFVQHIYILMLISFSFSNFHHLYVSFPIEQLAWWQRWDKTTLIILVAAILALLLAVIIICCIIICICRRRRRQDKCEYKNSYNNCHMTLAVSISWKYSLSIVLGKMKRNSEIEFQLNL